MKRHGILAAGGKAGKRASRRSSALGSPGFVHPFASRSTRSFSAAVNRRRATFATTSVSGATGRPSVIVDMLGIRLALYINFRGVGVSRTLAERVLRARNAMGLCERRTSAPRGLAGAQLDPANPFTPNYLVLSAAPVSVSKRIERPVAGFA